MKNKLMTREMAEVFANELDVTVRTLVRNYGVVIVPSVNDMQISSSFKVPVCEARGYNTKAEREAMIEANIADLFGPVPDPVFVTAMAKDCLAFAKFVKNNMKVKLGVDRVRFNLYQECNLRAAVRHRDFTKMIRILAESKLEVGESGRHWFNGIENGYSAGWGDFVEYRATKTCHEN